MATEDEQEIPGNVEAQHVHRNGAALTGTAFVPEHRGHQEQQDQEQQHVAQQIAAPRAIPRRNPGNKDALMARDSSIQPTLSKH